MLRNELEVNAGPARLLRYPLALQMYQSASNLMQHSVLLTVAYVQPAPWIYGSLLMRILITLIKLFFPRMNVASSLRDTVV